MPDLTRTDPSPWCPPCAAGNCPERCEEGCHHVCDIEALWRLAAAALHDRLFGYPVGDREGPQWDEAQALAGLVLHAIPEGWSKVDGEWRPQRSFGSRLRFVLHARRCAVFLSTSVRAMRRKGSHLPAPDGEPERDDCSRKTLINLDTSVRPGGIDCLFLEDLSDDKLDGLACVDCGRRGDPMVPVAQGPRGQLFACEYGCGQGPGYTEPPLDWDPAEPCSTCRRIGSACTCCQNCGAPNGRGRFEKRLAGETASRGAVCCPRCAADEGAPPGSTCHGTRSAATAPWRIQDAQACLAGEAVLEPAARDIPVEGEVWRQANGGFTLYALAAYGALRCRFRSAERVVVEAVEVTDHLGDRVLVTAVRIPGLSLLLSGATWGYAGTGPNGLAAILQDLGAFADHEAAIGWVSQLPIDCAWRLEIKAELA